jgi:Asp-tRNA(Asn)/Glu-tRNA(Gln) amidotransferase A subunit family amidase
MRSIADIAATVRSGDSTAVETVTAALDHAEASQADLNAFTRIDRDGALARAVGIDERIAGGESPGPLAGVPIALKDLIDQDGIPTTNGAVFETTPATESAIVVQRLEDAGAVIIGRTGLHEFAFGFTSENQHFGPVHNPWDLSLSPGGSSGGSAAAVSAGIVPAAIGTDTGGSIRVPAALCGTVGLKVTHGRVPLTGTTPLAPSLDTVGPLARSVNDATAIYLAIAGDDAADPWAAPVRVDRPGAPRDPSTLFVGVPRQWMEHPVDRITRDAFRGVLDRFIALGATVETVDEPILEITEAAANAAAAEVYQVHKERWESDPDRYGSDVAARIRRAQTIGLDAATEAMAWDAGVRHALDRIFGRFDVLITPTVGSTRKVIGEDDMDINGERIFHRAVIAQHTWPVNRAGNPALALPIESDGTPPSSLQLIGPRWGESSLLAIGLGLEEAGIVKVEEPATFFA